MLAVGPFLFSKVGSSPTHSSLSSQNNKALPAPEIPEGL